MKSPLILIILDGWGCSDKHDNNGIALANKPHFDHYWNTFPHTTIDASGPAVGLPKGIMGNSEVGHMNMGAGQIVFTGLSQIYKAIEDKSFFKNAALLKAIESAKQNDSALHLMGLLSDGAVHSHQDHLYALLELAKSQGLKKVFIHCFMDGRDTSPRDGSKYILQLQEKIKAVGVGQIASVSGRFFAMDRDKRWDRVEKAYDVLTGANAGGKMMAEDVMFHSYREETGDEFVVPTAIVDEGGKNIGPILDNDSVIFFNFRADRAREITQALTDKNFNGFVRKKFPHIATYVCMAPYDEKFDLPVAFTPNLPKRIFGEIVSEQNLKQLRIAETEKYAHVTFFFSGGREKEFPGEERVLVPSPREVATYDLKPEMSAVGITNEVLKKIASDQFDVIVLNFANSDMVGHTAKPQSIISAVETVDACLEKVLKEILNKNGIAVITADHGNAEQMVDDKGQPHTAHTTNLVPFMVIGNSVKNLKLKKTNGRLCDVAPTLLELMNLKKPAEMTGVSLIEK